MREPYHSDDLATVYHGDCVEVVRGLAPFDAVVCDPPYALTANKRGGTGEASLNLNSPAGRSRVTTGGGFMGKEWDAALPAAATWRAILDAAKPGAHLLAFGGTRTYHRLVCAIEDAGWEIRDCIMWVYGSGFPKSLDVSKAIDKEAGAERTSTGRVLSVTGNRAAPSSALVTTGLGAVNAGPQAHVETVPATDLARAWQGWGTALKPAYEPIVVARKPLDGTVAQNVARHGCGGINVDGCRVGFMSEADERESKEKNRHADFGSGARENRVFGADNRARGEGGNYNAPGRWPANVVHDGSEEVTAGFPIGDPGSSARFFYCAKAAASDRGLEEWDALPLFGEPAGQWRNTHPTVKPLALMRWLVKLVTPPGGVVLDPFAGSGSTVVAAKQLGTRSIAIEREIESCEIQVRRLQRARMSA